MDAKSIKSEDSEEETSEVLNELLNERYAEILTNCLNDEFFACKNELTFIKEIPIREKALQTIHKIMNKVQKQLIEHFYTHPVFKSPEYKLYASQINDDIDCNIDVLYEQLENSIPILVEKLHITMMNAVDQIRETYFKIKD